MRWIRFALASVLLLVLGSCGATPEPAGSETAITATLADGSITISPDTVAGGNVSVSVSNAGTMVHELEVFASSSTDLPVSKGVADTSGMTLIDEVEDIIQGANLTLDLDLDPGDYIIICNLPAHYELGMVTKLTVTG